ncbi:MAG: ABC transporter permease subunit [Acidobacteriota bacterium]|nr:ABC transporter permease subunit [Acidobacteriota bacterium]MDE3147572.1 ABC transporter permease subunit [Acidobacteriota bacterium]
MSIDNDKVVASATPPATNAAGRPSTEEIGRLIYQRRQRRLRRQRMVFLSIRVLSLAIVFIGWQIYGSHTIAILFAPITTVIHEGYTLFAQKGLGGQLLTSVETFFWGYVLGMVIGVFLGMLTGAYRAAEAAISMYIFALYATPMVALVPIISLWVGYNFHAQVVIVTLFVVWPVTVTVFHGIREIDPELLEVSRSLRLNRRQTWLHVLLPGAVPFIMTGATQGVAMGMVGVIIAEVQTQLTGIGDALQTQSSTYHTAAALAVILLIMALGLTLRMMLSLLKRWIVPWQREEQGRRH